MNIKLYIHILIILFLLNVNSLIKRTYSQSTITLDLLIYDNTPSRNPDFETSGGGSVEKGLVKTTLGADGTPVYCCGSQRQGTISNSTTFNSWFHNVPGVNLPITKTITLNQSPSNPNIYTYSNGSFFIIDGEGFDNKALYPNEKQYYDSAGKPHNFHFCAQAHTQFQYKTGDVFNFSGDDDVWVFINNKLVVDLGGLHTSAASSVNLDSLGLTNGQNYNFDFFYCERHTVMSTIQITTSLKFVCPKYDSCGVCQGDNSSCCLPSNCDNNPIYTKNCIQARCVNNVCNIPVASCISTIPCFDSVCKVGDGCQLVPKNCSSANNCWVDKCNNATNACEHIITPNCVNCPSTACITDDLCKPKICNDKGDGCVTTDKNCDDKNYCTTDTCVNGQCIHTPIANCVNCASIGCISTDLCNPLVCSTDGASCVNKPIVCNDYNYCTNDICNNGICSSTPIENCVNCSTTACITVDFCNVLTCDDSGTGCKSVPKSCKDGNYCTHGICQSPSGTCTQSLPDPNCVSCQSTSCITTDGCKIQQCNAAGDGCITQPLLCDDGNPCTTDSCVNNGTCSHETIPNCVACNPTFNCITTDLCKPLSCSGSSSNPTCVPNDYDCSDGNPCTKDSCSGNAVCAHQPIDDCQQCTKDIGCVTTDKCSPQVCNSKNDGCTTAPNECSGKGDKCNIPSCVSPGGSCVFTPKNCDDDDGCTIDSCNLSDGLCVHDPISNCQDCNDIGCITTDFCFPMICSADGKSCDKQNKTCDDSLPCTDDSCQSPIGACIFTPIANCVNCGKDKCITTDFCKPNKCGPTGCVEEDVNCDDNNACTTDSCNSSNGVCSSQVINDCVSCNNSFNCITTDYCKPLRCSGDSTNPSCEQYDKDCNDFNFCTVDTCTGAGICQHSTPDPLCTSCANTSCITTDLCDPQICNADGSGCISNPNKPCDDKNPCTTDSCSNGVCSFDIIPHCEVCSETLGCTTTDYCKPMVCSDDKLSCKETERDCSDGDDCTTDTCSQDQQKCLHTLLDNCLKCGDNYCYLEDKCYPIVCTGDDNSECGNTTLDCNDNNPCTMDECLHESCMYTLIKDCNVCNETFSCVGTPCFPKECVSTDNNATFTCLEVDKTTGECDDGNNCTITKCEPITGTCSNVFIPHCQMCSTPGVFCITTDLCRPLICNEAGDACQQTEPDCNDHLFCTNDRCINGSCVNEPVPTCVECKNQNLMPLIRNNKKDFRSKNIEIKHFDKKTKPLQKKIDQADDNGGFGCYNPDKCILVSCINATACEYTPIKCDDSNPCSIDECEQGVCYHYPISIECQVCTPLIGCATEDQCIINQCSETLDSCVQIPRNCSDGDDCTTDSCENGKCIYTRIPGCGRMATPTPRVYSCDNCHEDEICIFKNHRPTCVKNPNSGVVTTGHFTESGTVGVGNPLTTSANTISQTIGNNPCQYVDCGKGLECYVIHSKAECMPSNYKCMDCLDLECYLQDLSCMMIDNPNYISDKSCGKYDGSCCRFIPTCIPIGYYKQIQQQYNI